jgi:uncharacterized protein (DUF1778 family)
MGYALQPCAEELALTQSSVCITCVAKTKSLLVLAAELSGATNLTDYILRAAVERAQADLLSQQTFALKKGPWNEFAKRLDAPARDLPRLRKLLMTPDVFARAAQST